MKPTPVNRPEDRDTLLDRIARHADLGHAARNAALVRQIELLTAAPGTSPANAAGPGTPAWASLMSLYRFVGNDKVSLSDLRDLRARAVRESLPDGAEVLIAHDVTLLDYSRHNRKRDRRPIGDHGGMGYEYFPCVAIDPATKTVLGVVHDTVVDADGPDDRDVMDYDADPLFRHFSRAEKKRLAENHRHQLAVHVRGLGLLLSGLHVTHVADREFDDHFDMDACLQAGHDFVFRCLGNRNVQIAEQPWIPRRARTAKQAGHPLPDGWICVNLQRLVPAVALQPYKSLPLDSRNRVVPPASATRTADLSIGACAVRLYRCVKRNKRYVRPPRTLNVNMVVIRETHPPRNVTPVHWILFTSRPIQTLADLCKIATLYELRWLIEEFFHLLKSAYHIEASRLTDAAKIARLLVLLTLAATTVVQLKSTLNIPAKGPLPEPLYRQVRTAMAQLDNPRLDPNLRLFALIVGLGGWIGRRNDPIGPTVLMRGQLKLLAIAHAFHHLRPALDDLLASPHPLLGRILRV